MPDNDRIVPRLAPAPEARRDTGTAAGGADSSPLENEPGGEKKEAAAEEDLRSRGEPGRSGKYPGS